MINEPPRREGRKGKEEMTEQGERREQGELGKQGETREQGEQGKQGKQGETSQSVLESLAGRKPTPPRGVLQRGGKFREELFPPKLPWENTQRTRSTFRKIQNLKSKIPSPLTPQRQFPQRGENTHGTGSPSPLKLLVTGGAGFIGSNFVHYWCNAYPDDKVVVLDALTYAGNKANLQGLLEKENFRFVQGDISDRSLVEQLLAAENINIIAHFAAQSHVDRSILTPGAFVQTNVVGTFTLLEAFRQHWEANNKSSDYRFLHVSTDEVYGSLGANDPAFTETTPYAPNSPYSASKAGSDHLVRAYYHTYGLPTFITNCSNNYGAYQFPEKLIPLMCINILMGKSLPVYGDGQNIRDWLYVGDHCSALDVVLHSGSRGETYNIGGNNEVKNIELVKMLCQIMDELAPNLPVYPSHQLINFVKDRPGHDRRYAIDATKIKTQLGWTPSVTVQEGLRTTVEWYLTHREWWEPLLSPEYKAYYQKIYTN